MSTAGTAGLHKAWTESHITTLLQAHTLSTPSAGHYSGQDPWVDSACAYCPAFLVLDAAGRLSSFVRERQVASELALASWPLQADSWIRCPILPFHP